MSTTIAQNPTDRIGSRSVRARRANGRTTERARPGVLNCGLHLPGSSRRPPGVRREAAGAIAPEAPVLDWADRKLLDACRRDFPICERPFAELARCLDDRAGDVLQRFEGLERCGVVNWIGPVPAPGSAGASTQVAMAVPKARLRSVREAVIRYRGISHMVEREHEFNLWFALAAPNAGALYDAIADIRRRTGVEVLDLRLERDYCGDAERPSPDRTPPAERRPPPEESDRRLLAAVQEGLTLTARPYAAVAKRIGISEAQVIERLNCLVSEGLIARMGVVVRHDAPHRLGANALVVFDVSRHAVDRVGERLAEAQWIDRCHRCIPRAPTWPYSLYCTLDDRDLARLICWVDDEFFGTVRCPRRAVLFCRACYSACEEN